jgi:hypothetical protein
MGKRGERKIREEKGGKEKNDDKENRGGKRYKKKILDRKVTNPLKN